MIEKLTEHIKETDKCCFCGKEYTDYGNSTWGVWTAEEEKAGFGEAKRCCAECNIKIVEEARREKAAAVKEGKIENVLQDSSEVIYEWYRKDIVNSKDLINHGELIKRVYDNGLYRKIDIPAKDDKIRKRKDIIYGKELSVVPKLREFYKENQDIIDSLSEQLKDPYFCLFHEETCVEIIRFGKKVITGSSIFGAMPDVYYDEILEVKRTSEKDAVIQQIRTIGKLVKKIEDLLESEFPRYKKERDDFRKRVARNMELNRKK